MPTGRSKRSAEPIRPAPVRPPVSPTSAGTHNLALFVTGLTVDAVAADLATFVSGRRLDDNAHVLMRRARRAHGQPGRSRQPQ
jgi:hypothetical protein